MRSSTSRYYEHDCGIPYEHNEHWTAFFGAIADRIVNDLHPRSSLDAGCAMGFLVEQLYIRGVDAYGVDISEYAISKVPEPVADRCRVASLVEPIDGTLRPRHVHRGARAHGPGRSAQGRRPTCAPSPTACSFSSSPLDYSEATHVNVRPPEAWAADFAAHGFFRNLDYDATYLTPWAVLYERRSDDPGDIVRDYDRVQTRMEAEIRQLRENALQASHARDVEATAKREATRASRRARCGTSKTSRANCSRCATPSSGSRWSSAKRWGRPRTTSRSLAGQGRGGTRVRARDRVEGVPRDGEGAVAVSPRARISSVADVRPPRLSIVTPVFNPPADILRKTLESVRAQTSGNWEHWLVDDGSTAAHVRPMLEEAAAQDSRVNVEFRSEQGGIVAATNDAVEHARSDFVAFMDHDDELAPTAVESCTRALASEPDIDYLYTDEDKIDLDGEPLRPVPQARLVARAACAARCTRATSASCGARCSTRSGVSAPATTAPRTGTSCCASPNRRARCITCPRSSTTGGSIRRRSRSTRWPSPTPTRRGGGRSRTTSNRIGMQNEVVEFEGLPGSNRIRPALRETPLVSIIMPTAGRLRVVHGMRTNLVVHAVRSIVQRTTYPNYEIVVVADTDTPDATVCRVARGRRRSCARRPVPRRVQLLGQDQPGRVPRARRVSPHAQRRRRSARRGWKDRSLDDVGPSDWLECLLGYATHPDIGSVGAKMYLGDRRLQHVGIISTSGSVPAHPYRGFHGGFLGYIGNAIMPCNYIAVTGACLMTRRAVFDEVGGMSAAFPINYQDVDYGLKLRAKGYRTVYNPEVELFHFESSSRCARCRGRRSAALLRARWGKILAHDPYYHPGFVEHYADFVHPHYTDDGRFIAKSPAA